MGHVKVQHEATKAFTSIVHTSHILSPSRLRITRRYLSRAGCQFFQPTAATSSFFAAGPTCTTKATVMGDKVQWQPQLQKPNLLLPSIHGTGPEDEADASTTFNKETGSSKLHNQGFMSTSSCTQFSSGRESRTLLVTWVSLTSDSLQGCRIEFVPQPVQEHAPHPPTSQNKRKRV